MKNLSASETLPTIRSCLDVCDEKYAVMNADEWLKRKATGTVGYCEEDGVTKWLAENAVFGG